MMSLESLALYVLTDPLISLCVCVWKVLRMVIANRH